MLNNHLHCHKNIYTRSTVKERMAVPVLFLDLFLSNDLFAGLNGNFHVKLRYTCIYMILHVQELVIREIG